MNERIKKLRNSLNLSAEKFGSRVGVTRSAISRIENGIVNVTEQMIHSICREWNLTARILHYSSGEEFLSAQAKIPPPDRYYLHGYLSGGDQRGRSRT